MAVNILHLSDIHFTRKSHIHDQTVILTALRNDLKVLCDGPTAPNLVIVSGDLAREADEKDIYFHLSDFLLAEISKITRCDETRIILCPGNHDAHQAVVERRARDLPALRTTLLDRSELNDGYLASTWHDQTSETFKCFFEISEFFARPVAQVADPLVNLYSFEQLGIDVISVNTAWLTAAGLKALGKDDRKLLIPEAAIERALQHCKPNSERVLVTHHPLTWLTESNEDSILNSLKGINFHLYGHVHNPRPTKLADASGGRLTSQAGAVFYDRERYNGYSLVRTERKDGHSAVWLRSYYEPRKEFGKAEDRLPGGIFYPTSSAEKFWKKADARIDRRALLEWTQNELRPHAIDKYNEGIIARPISEVFVEPPLVRSDMSIEVLDDAGVPVRVEAPVSLDNLIRDAENVIFYGNREYGKTTLLQQFALGILGQPPSEEFHPKVPILIEFQDIRLGTKTIERLLSQAALAEPVGFTITQLLEEGFVVILIDNANFGDKSGSQSSKNS